MILKEEIGIANYLSYLLIYNYLLNKQLWPNIVLKILLIFCNNFSQIFPFLEQVLSQLSIKYFK